MNSKPLAKAHPPDKTVIALLILASLGLLLIFFGTRTDAPKESADPLEAYLDITERKLCETVARIKGAGTVTVFVTPERTVLPQSDVPAISVSGEAADGGRVYPKIGGVLVVCSGGNDEAVAAEIRNAVGAALGLTKNKIYVTGGVG